MLSGCTLWLASGSGFMPSLLSVSHLAARPRYRDNAPFPARRHAGRTALGRRRVPSARNHAAPCELPRLLGVASEADFQLAGAPVNGDAHFGVGQHVAKVVSGASVTDAEIVSEAERPCPLRYRLECSAKQVPQDLRGPRQQVGKALCLRVDIRAHGGHSGDQTPQVGAVQRGADLLLLPPCHALGHGGIFGDGDVNIAGHHALVQVDANTLAVLFSVVAQSMADRSSQFATTRDGTSTTCNRSGMVSTG
jgi:hypothetical protein